jgi:hypothetical protein
MENYRLDLKKSRNDGGRTKTALVRQGGGSPPFQTEGNFDLFDLLWISFLQIVMLSSQNFLFPPI